MANCRQTVGIVSASRWTLLYAKVRARGTVILKLLRTFWITWVESAADLPFCEMWTGRTDLGRPKQSRNFMYDEGAFHTESASDGDLFGSHAPAAGWLAADACPNCLRVLASVQLASALMAIRPMCQCTCRHLTRLSVHLWPLVRFASALAVGCPFCRSTCGQPSVLPKHFPSLSYIAGALPTGLRFVGALQVHKQGRIMYPECTGKIKTGRKCTENTACVGPESQRLKDGDP